MAGFDVQTADHVEYFPDVSLIFFNVIEINLSTVVTTIPLEERDTYIDSEISSYRLVVAYGQEGVTNVRLLSDLTRRSVHV